MSYANLEQSENGYLLDTSDWSEDIAGEIAAVEDLAPLNARQWDVINFLRDEYFSNNQHQPNERAMVKAMSEKWGEKFSTKGLYELFPMQPSKQAAKIAGLPETKRKGGY
ncbi:TusE/DsrC/DsvC family sulfur relay protein [Varunaivibrio sulfuroxidans]|uniref:tRNA 2-thiouridine synthesizing protein E n=1 Tax=Varunaivibrio sulfuroxidans TaxID=1773489 RepID=A0A4R3JAG8_9PROT|nr:TusE/DsrC/DsvC family sulfur relay protein [Varunaivibrio sulfuroxidans]TCS62547.1 tRNA 2-thiouridine synthesizing protein E [Varunaivibrio sulfuroxidans]WES30783.1 TusE/DsrC/DsvC family sulfur relay protein [Varunaivibrio sulfuroxidans]